MTAFGDKDFMWQYTLSVDGLVYLIMEVGAEHKARLEEARDLHLTLWDDAEHRVKAVIQKRSLRHNEVPKANAVVFENGVAISDS